MTIGQQHQSESAQSTAVVETANRVPSGLAEADLRPTEVGSKVRFQMEMESHSGQFPLPRHIREYEDIYPGAAKIVFEMARDEQQKAFQQVDYNQRNTVVGQRFGFLAVLAALTSATICACVGQPWPASVIGGTTIVAILAAFITGRISFSGSSSVQPPNKPSEGRERQALPDKSPEES